MQGFTPARLLAASFLVAASATPLFASDWRVPADFPTIQAAIDSPDVAAGDSIFVGPGTFAGGVVNKGVHIQGVGEAVIDSGSAFEP